MLCIYYYYYSTIISIITNLYFLYWHSINWYVCPITSINTVLSPKRENWHQPPRPKPKALTTLTSAASNTLIFRQKRQRTVGGVNEIQVIKAFKSSCKHQAVLRKRAWLRQFRALRFRRGLSTPTQIKTKCLLLREEVASSYILRINRYTRKERRGSNSPNIFAHSVI